MSRASLALLVLLFAAGPTPAGAADFSHAAHLARGLECAACHEVKSAPARPHLNLENGCVKCHESGAPQSQPLPTQRHLDAVFPHTAHAKFACTTCHLGVTDDKIPPGGGPVLTQQQCASCHAEQHVGVSSNACERCHGEDRTKVRPATHGPNWRKTHGAEAAWRTAYDEHGQDCRQCHSKSSCTECHDVMAPTDHTGLWRMQAHGIAAEWDRDRCKTCHETATCVRCHQVTEPMNHAGPWLQLHGLAAGARVSESCSVCHQPAWCAACHAASTRP